MEFEDSRFALFPEPNAYIQRVENKKEETKKIVFQEPYESLPAFYLDNNFKKGDCFCNKQKCNDKHNVNNNSCHNHCDNNASHNNCGNNQKSKGFGFDLKSLLPMLGLFNKGGGADLSNIVGLLNNTSVTQNSSNANPINLITNLMSNKDAMSGILNMFKGGGLNLFNKRQTAKKELKTTDFEIKNYTRVE